MLKEVHYTIFFADNSATDLLAYNITNVTVDVVYGDFTPTSCSDILQPTIKSSLQFKQSIYARKNSGSPGYIKGS
jgi:hypothetical protein